MCIADSEPTAAQEQAGAEGTSSAAENGTETSNRALYDALRSLEERFNDDANGGGPAVQNADGSTLRSKSMQDVEGLALEVRSFVQGIKSQVDRFQGNAAQRIKLEAETALSVADFLLRRTLLDGARALAAAGSSAFLALGAASSSATPAEEEESAASADPDGTAAAAAAREEAMPFATRLGSIEKRRTSVELLSLPAGSDEGAQLLADESEGAVLAAQEAEAWVEQAQVQRQGVAEAVELAKETLM